VLYGIWGKVLYGITTKWENMQKIAQYLTVLIVILIAILVSMVVLPANSHPVENTELTHYMTVEEKWTESNFINGQSYFVSCGGGIYEIAQRTLWASMKTGHHYELRVRDRRANPNEIIVDDVVAEYFTN